MLRKKIKIAEGNKFERLEFDDFYLSPDLTFFSGTTDIRNGLTTGDIIRYKLGNLEFDSTQVITEDVLRQGVVTYHEYYPIERDEYYGKDIMYVMYNGVVYYYNGSGFTITEDNGIDALYECEPDAEEVLIQTEAYIESGKVIIGEDTYLVDLDSGTNALVKYNHMSQRLTEYNDMPVSVFLNERSAF